MSFVRGPTAFVAAILAGVCGLLLLGLTLLTTGSMSRIDTPVTRLQSLFVVPAGLSSSTTWICPMDEYQFASSSAI